VILRKKNIVAKELCWIYIILWNQQDLFQSYFVALSNLVFGSIKRSGIRGRKLNCQKENIINFIIKAFELFCVVKNQYL